MPRLVCTRFDTVHESRSPFVNLNMAAWILIEATGYWELDSSHLLFASAEETPLDGGAGTPMYGPSETSGPTDDYSDDSTD